MMQSVVEEGTGRNAKVKGYSIGGKTGTSEDGVNSNKYVTSFVGIADTNNPELAIVIILYNPTGEGGHQGGAVAAPIASQILGEVLPYLEVSKNEEEITNSITMPDITGITLKDAKDVLKNLNLEMSLNRETNNLDAIVIEQIPKKGIMINTGTKVILDVKED